MRANPEPARGDGPGVITQDGCAVEVYLRLPYRGELELLARHLPPQCSILGLGCGTGRLTRHLLEQGHAVTAVDKSPDDSTRRAQLAACRRHLSPGGTLLFQRFDPAWLRAVEPGPFPSAGEVEVGIERVVRRGDVVDMSIRYAIGEAQWRHHFTARAIDDDDVRLAMIEAGFGSMEWIDVRWGAAKGAG